MRKRWVFNLVLLGLVAVLVTVVWHDRRESGERPILSLNSETVQRILIQRPNREALRLRKEDGSWRITGPERVSASAFHVRQVLEAAAASGVTRYAESDVDPERLGLDPPRVRLQLDDHVLLFGGTDAMDGLRYVQFGDQVYLVRDAVGPLLEGPWWNFIDRHPVPPESTLVRVETSGYTLERVNEGWRLDGAVAGLDEPDRLAANWRRASALVVRPTRRRPDAEADVELTFGDGRQRRFVIETESGEERLVNMASGLAYVFDPASRAYLLTGRPEAAAPESGVP